MERLTPAGAVFETDHRSSSTLRYHRHGIAFATIVLDGAYTEVRDDAPRACARGAVVVHAAGEEHADHFIGPTRCLNVELPKALAASRLGAHPSARDARVSEGESVDAAAFGAVARAFYHGDDAQLGAAVRAAHASLGAAPRRGAAPPEWMRAVMEEFVWTGEARLGEAAKLAGVHQAHFSRAFRRHAGLTACANRARARVHLASRLLLTSGAPLSTIALECGFSDQSHLTRTFGAAVGLAPGAYRRIFAR